MENADSSVFSASGERAVLYGARRAGLGADSRTASKTALLDFLELFH